VITMPGSSKIEVDGGSGNGQRQRNGWQDGKGIAMDDGTKAAQRTVQWAADNCHGHRSSAIEGNVRWMAAAHDGRPRQDRDGRRQQ
jgi:hypothetical protein